MRRSSNHMKSLVQLGFIISSILAAICLIHPAQACGPGRAGGRRLHNRLRKYPPLVQHQYIPNVSENTLGASGRPEGPIKRRDPRFKQLVQNWNPDIEFRDDERTGADRMMTQRLKEKLSVLAISVMNQWPNVRLRVIEGWDEDMRHSANSLHYEGRAVDITTSDKDKSKYGMLARLAVEAGFDWVHYESRSHVHCSVKSEKADTIRNNGCFDAKSLVETPLGQVEMSQLQTNDLVLAMDAKTGQLQYSPVILWLDRDESSSELYVELTTKSGQLIRLTSSHLIYAADELPPSVGSSNGDNIAQSAEPDPTTSLEASGNAHPRYYYEYNSRNPTNSLEEKFTHATNATKWHSATTVASSKPELTRALQAEHLKDFVYTDYARNLLVGQYLLTSALDQQIELASATTSLEPASRRHANRLSLSRKFRLGMLETLESTSRPKVLFDQIVSVNFVNRQGIYAPLTREGNIVVNSVLASCYALISDHNMAHSSFAPIRWLNILQEKAFGLFPATPLTERLTETLQRRTSLQADHQARQSQPNTLDHNTTNGLNRTLPTGELNQSTRHIHWYAIFLYNIARLLLPDSYLY